MKKLYAYIEENHGLMGQSALAGFLNISPQRICNWQSRGISKEGALMVQLVLGIDAIDLLDPELTTVVKEPRVPYKAKKRPKP
jgi:hypothetical protein